MKSTAPFLIHFIKGFISHINLIDDYAYHDTAEI